MHKFFNDIKKRSISVVIGLIVVSAMIISSCEAVSGPGGLANGDAALSASRTNVVGININTDFDLSQIGINPNFPANGNYDLTSDLTLTNWTPICGPRATGPFTGTFDGHGYTIEVTGFNTGAATDGNLGIFAVIGDGTTYPVVEVSNLAVDFEAGPIVSTTVQYVGGLVGSSNTAVYTNIEVTGNFDVTGGPIIPPDPPAPGLPSVNVGGVAGFAASSSFSDVLVEASFGTALLVSPDSPAPKWEIWQGDGIFRVRPAAPGVTGQDGLTTGGVAGYAQNSQFRRNDVSGDLNARTQTQGNPVYAGGIVGAATGTNVDDSVTSIRVIGSGSGYNTSAGGVAGYITASRVRNSSASGRIDLRGESLAFDWEASWQVYAGGLVGYAGGTDAAPSLIDHSYAAGDIYAFAPYPYSGGLVGYLYGYNDFANPAKNGSTVSRSYATGVVRAETQTDTANNIADIPYAGGLVGYSSVTDSTIVDSYATGPATVATAGTYAWAGGLVGGNANNAVVLRTYATGTVTSTTGTLSPLYNPEFAPTGPAAGGIAGFNYYTADTLVSHSVALNNTVTGNQGTTQNVVHRVAGSLGDNTGHDGTLNTNYANGDMSISINWKPNIGLNVVDGEDIASPPLADFYTRDLGWDFSNIWQLTGTYPTLR
jgi:hypothetical protein